MLGLATAFEDFEYNTEENAALLIKEGTLVGETKKLFEGNGYDALPYSIDFPVALDYLVQDAGEFYTHQDALNICEQNPGFRDMNGNEQEQAVSNIMRNLKSLGRSSYTFTVNLMRGTPSWVIFDRDMNMLEHWFGHRDKEAVFELLDRHAG